MKIKKILLSILTGLLVIGWVTINYSEGGNPPNIKASLALTGSRAADRLIYLLNDPIPIVFTLKNDDVSIYTAMGFKDTRFHILLTFTGPDGKIVAAELLDRPTTEPPPPNVIVLNGDFVQVEKVETIDTGWIWTIGTTPFNAKDYYALTKAGRYSVKAIIPMRTYSGTIPGTDSAPIDSATWEGALESNTIDFSIIADADGDGYYYPEAYGQYSVPDCNDNNPAIHPGANEIRGNGIDENCNPLDDGDIVAKGTLIIKADKHIVGNGWHPHSKKEPLGGLPLKVIKEHPNSKECPYNVSWKNYENIYKYCPSVVSGFTERTGDKKGTITLTVPPGNYIVIAEYNPDNKTSSDDAIYIKESIGYIAADQTKKKYLQVIERADGKWLPGKCTEKTGSQLLIIEPEYVEWDGTQALYPFIFESVGDWDVTTSVSPPEGFVTDYQSLATEVNNDLSVLQFTITDVGSEWVDTKVEHKIKHKGKTEIVKTKIGVKKKKKKK